MTIKEYLKNKGIGFYISLLTLVLSIVSFIVYFPYASYYVYNGFVVFALIFVMIVAAAVCFVKPGSIVMNYAMLLIPIFSAITVAVALYQNFTILQAWVTGLLMYGDASEVGRFLAFLIITLITAVVAAIGCFFNSTKKVSE